MTTGKTIALTRWTSADKVMSLIFNMLSRLVINFLPRSKHLLISWLLSPSAVILEPRKIKSATVSTVPQWIGYCKYNASGWGVGRKRRVYELLFSHVWNLSFAWTSARPALYLMVFKYVSSLYDFKLVIDTFQYIICPWTQYTLAG